MATATTSSVWRSTGGDQTRTAAAGSMVMKQPFYIANLAATSNVVVSSTLANSAVILPAGAVVTDVSFFNSKDTTGKEVERARISLLYENGSTESVVVFRDQVGDLDISEVKCDGEFKYFPAFNRKGYCVGL